MSRRRGTASVRPVRHPREVAVLPAEVIPGDGPHTRAAPSGAGPARRWVVFDLDGTLFDYERAEAAAVAATLDDAGVTPTAQLVAAYREVNAAHWRRLELGETTAARLRVERWHDVFATVGVRPPVEAATLAARYLGHLAAGSQLIEGAVEVVRTLALDHGIALLTNGLADVQRPRLAATPLATLAEVVIISDEVGAAKPDPAIFDAAFVAMGQPDRDAVTLVGDSLTADIAGAARYGVRSVWFAPEHDRVPRDAPQPDHHIRELSQLPALLAG